jgi:hypothetical protein
MAITNYLRGQTVFKGTVTGMAARKAFYPAQTDTVREVAPYPTILYGWFIYNPNDSVAYLQFFDSATVILGTTVPALSLGIPGGGGANMMSDIGIVFNNALQLAVTTTSSGNTAPVAGIDVNVYFQ